ncbi:rho GTPase-activating protein 24-like [Asterias rubens]|uniref:rho GTPase-activating protein 24-like n=1 Tax=Asterias rubens TaxID=7604 RepID=UPI00145598AC|nr:rho GTPase-activating protein 24-like [Asterias rubens]
MATNENESNANGPDLDQDNTSSAPEEGSKTAGNEAEGVTENMKCGWLRKRTKLSHKWERRWFLLKSNHGNTLQYGNDAESLDKSIPLIGTEIAEAEIDRKKFVFRLKPSDTRRTYYLQAESKEELQVWMQAICFAKAASHQGDTSQACSIQ